LSAVLPSLPHTLLLPILLLLSLSCVSHRLTCGSWHTIVVAADDTLVLKELQQRFADKLKVKMARLGVGGSSVVVSAKDSLWLREERFKIVLIKPPIQRSDDDVRVAAQYLLDLKFFSRLGITLVKKLCRVVEYVTAKAAFHALIPPRLLNTYRLVRPAVRVCLQVFVPCPKVTRLSTRASEGSGCM